MMNIKNFLKNVNAIHLQKKISRFRDLDFKHMLYKDVQAAIWDVIGFETPYGTYSILIPASGQCPVGTRFYRVRSLPEGGVRQLQSMDRVTDCWEPPERIVRAGRLNRDKESLLYTALRPDVAIDEMKIGENNLFFLIVYESIEPIYFSIIGSPPNVNGMNADEELKMKIIQDFLRHEFIRDVGGGTEYLYRISESIAKDYFDLPLQDAWYYPSIAKRGGDNICFKKESKHKLKLVGVQIASFTREETGYLFNVEYVASESEDGVSLSFHEIGSESQRKIFPEISMKDATDSEL